MLSHGHTLLSPWTLRMVMNSPQRHRKHQITNTPSGNGKRWFCPGLWALLWEAAAGSLTSTASEAQFPSSAAEGKKLPLLTPFFEKPHTQSAMRAELLLLHGFPRAPSCCNSAEHHPLKQSFVYIKSYFKHGNGIILYLYRAIHPRGSQNVSATYGQQLFNSGWYDCTAVQGRSRQELHIQQELQGEFRQVKQNYPNCNLAKTPGANISLLTKCCP